MLLFDFNDNTEFEFSEEKSQWLLAHRGIGFEEIVTSIRQGALLDVTNHPNQEKYPYQQICMVEAREYVYMVPFIAKGNKVFLKTIYPSRKATKRYGKNIEAV